MKFCWITINVKDMEKSLDFYRGIVGLPLNRRFKASPDVELSFLGKGDTQVELICNAKNGESGFGKDISLGFEVPSLEEVTGVLKDKNIPVIAGPLQPNPTVRFIYVLDPDGLKIQFVENLEH